MSNVLRGACAVLALLFLTGCGESGTTVVKAPPAPAAPAKAEPLMTAEGMQILAFDFEEEDPCAGCIGSVTKVLGKLPGVKKNDAEKGKRSFTVEFDPKLIEADKLVAALKDCGEGVKPKLD
jgi:copper chaperone CopZ